MRVVLVSHTSWVEHHGGVETHLRALAEGLVGRGHEVVHVHGSHHPAGAPAAVAVAASGAVRRYEIRRDDCWFDAPARVFHAGASSVWSDLVRELRPDLVHVHHWVNLSNDLVTRAVHERVPVAVTLHDAWTTCPRAFRVHRDGSSCSADLAPASCASCIPAFGHETAAEQAAVVEAFRARSVAELSNASAVFVADPSLRDLVLGKLQPLPPDFARRFVTVPLAELSTPDPDTPAATDPTRPFRFGWWGVGAVHKGVGDLLDAFELLHSARSEGQRAVGLRLFGPFPDDSLRTRIERLQAQGLDVESHGPFERADLGRSGLDAAVFPSRAFETWALAVDEAVALGLPLIVSAHGAPARRLGDGALRVPPGDPRRLSESMALLVDDASTVARLRSAQRALAAAPAPRPVLDVVLEVYERLVAAGAPALVEPATGEADRARDRLLQLQSESSRGRTLPPDGPS